MLQKNEKDAEQEYVRLQEELLMRIKNCYGNSSTLASFYLIFYATVTAALLQFLCSETFFSKSINIIIFGFIACIVFTFPILIMHSFAVKFKENFLSVCNICAYITFYHELPSISKISDIGGKKWELLSYDTLAPEAKFENKEYFLLSTISIILFLGSAILETCLIVKYFPKEKIFIGLLVFYLVFSICLTFNILYLFLIAKDSNIKNLRFLRKNIEFYYQIQHERFSDITDKQKLVNEIEEFQKNNRIIRAKLKAIGISEYHYLEIFKYLYNKKYEENSYFIKIKSKAKKKNLSIKDYINSIKQKKNFFK